MSETLRPGDPSGHGRYGHLDEADDKVLCHECGGWFRSVGHHLPPGHGMQPRDYRVKHGLPLTLALMSSTSSAKASRSAIASGRVEVIETIRDPLAAAAARNPEAARLGQRRRRWLDRDRIARAAGYADLDDALERTADLTVAAAARAMSVPESTMRRWRKALGPVTAPK